MRELKREWLEIRALENTLPPFVWLVSIEDELRGTVGGRITQVGAARGAQLLHAKSHRQATEAEILAHSRREEAAKRQARDEDLQRSGVALVVVPAAPPRRK